MLFNSIDFLLFLPLAFTLYWLLWQAPVRAQNLLLIVLSYIFYGWWDARFLILIALSSAFDFVAGRGLARTESEPIRRRWLALSLISNLGILFAFKYYGFFASSAAVALSSFGIQPDFFVLNVVLPVGISFYTFQTLSYTIDVYRRTAIATDDPVAFFAYVAFFPQLVAGPIERSGFLGQFLKRRSFDPKQANDGMRQILWGLFKKVAVADACAAHVDYIFSHYSELPGLVLLGGACLFTIQVYADFSGYSDIAIGTGRLFGFSLSRNFRYPLFAPSIPDLWSRWHLTLTAWFRDYVFRPLGGVSRSTARTAVNVLAVFALSGFWHGADWKFIVWGLLNGILFVVSVWWSRRKRRSSLRGWNAPRPARITWTFLSFSLASVFFRADSVSAASAYLARLLTNLDAPFVYAPGLTSPAEYAFQLAAIAAMFSVEWVNQRSEHGLERIRAPIALRWAGYWILALVLLQYLVRPAPFVYFQF